MVFNIVHFDSSRFIAYFVHRACDVPVRPSSNIEALPFARARSPDITRSQHRDTRRFRRDLPKLIAGRWWPHRPRLSWENQVGDLLNRPMPRCRAAMPSKGKQQIGTLLLQVLPFGLFLSAKGIHLPVVGCLIFLCYPDTLFLLYAGVLEAHHKTCHGRRMERAKGCPRTCGIIYFLVTCREAST